MSTPSCSARILQPFKRYVDARRLDRDLVPRDFWSAGANSRVSLEAAQAMLDGGIERLGDKQLGLKLGRSMCFGEGGPFDYAVRSASTVRDALDVAARYSILVSDSLSIGFELWRRKAVIRLHESAWTRPAAEFAMAAFHKIHLSDALPAAAQVECWFPYASPPDLTEHRRSFVGARLKFNAACFAFAFDGAYERAPLQGADAVLHAAHCARVDSLLSEQAETGAFKIRVRRVIEDGLRETLRATVSRVARVLHMSGRTMSRRLEREGTTFSEEVDEARRRLALVYLDDPGTSVKDAAFRLGFSHPESFHRAFKRWTSETPVRYRNARPVDHR